MDLLIDPTHHEYNWQDYGGHHHENIFTKFSIGYWQYEKFKSDKRIITYSAQIISKEIDRNTAKKIIETPPLSESDIADLKKLVIKKLDLNEDGFNNIWNGSNKSFRDYPSYYRFLTKYYLRKLKIILLQLSSSIFG